MICRRCAVLLLCLTGCPSAAEQRPLRIAAAADLVAALPALMVMSSPSSSPPAAVFGASATLARQLREGAPFDIFLAASTHFARAATQTGRCDPRTLRPYATGRLALFWRPERGAVTTIGDLARPSFVRIAIANPAHAPYGIAAMQALERAGLASATRDRLVVAENVQHALQLAEQGNTEAAIAAVSLVRRAGRLRHLVLPPSSHEPIVQTLVLCDRTRRREALSFAELLLSSAGQAVLSRHGFAPPAEGR